jgi:hypothetical protein
MAATPFTARASLELPPDDGLPPATIPADILSTFETLADQLFKVTGAATQVVNLAALPAAGAKAVLIEVSPDTSPSAAPILVTLNGGDEPVEVSRGGFIMLANPNPVAGITAISFAHTTAARVRVRALG